jgi:hypothetical protein
MRAQLDFFASLTLTQSDIRKIVTCLIQEGYPVEKYLGHLLITPLFCTAESIDRVRSLQEQYRAEIMFDSGGYYVQTGKLAYSELYYPLLKYYLANDWADVYVLPDHVPTAQDSTGEVWAKVEATVDFSRRFFDELPVHLQERAMPVVQGHTYEQVEHCLKHYLALGVRFLGFGSFGTGGQNSELNVTTAHSVELARHVVNIARQHGARVHFFGLGAPALTATIYGSGANTFDSSSWIKAAGFGQVFLPFMRAYNVSHRNGSSELQKGITIGQFNEWRELTGHKCTFCEDVAQLQAKKMYRTVHNLMVIKDTVALLNEGSFDTIRQIYESGSPRYHQEYQKWLQQI